MKRRKSNPAKTARKPSVHKRRPRQRPIHKRVLLHPFSAFVLLCVGVLVAGSTFRSQADSYEVTATVPAPVLAQEATISSPTNQQHVTQEPVTLTGDCPNDSYIKLYRDGHFSGVALCGDGHFSITASLELGANELQARVFNLTDQEGPASSKITVYYDRPVAATNPTSVPTTLKIANVDDKSYKTGAVREVSSNPTLSGQAPPFSDVVITFYSTPSVCKTKANASGFWRCTLPHALVPGLHHVVIEATTPQGKKLTFPTFEVAVTQYAEPFMITSDYRYQVVSQGQLYNWQLALSGGTAPYGLMVDWGDGSTSRVTRPDTAEFTISHKYEAPALSDRDYAVLITATDARGATTVLQLTAVVKSSAIPVSSGGNTVDSLLDSVQRWLWVVWPVYIAVVLMALSFWIGEREAYQRFLARKRAHPKGR